MYLVYLFTAKTGISFKFPPHPKERDIFVSYPWGTQDKNIRKNNGPPGCREAYAPSSAGKGSPTPHPDQNRNS
jgi:hypothetical protein